MRAGLNAKGAEITVEFEKGIYKFDAAVAFEKITLNQDNIEGELCLLTPPQFHIESIIYRYLIAGWQNFLGGRVPNAVLPDSIRIVEKLYKLFEVLIEHYYLAIDDILDRFALRLQVLLDKIEFVNKQNHFFAL